MHLDCFLDMHIVVLRSSSKALKLRVEIVERHLNFSSSTEISLGPLIHDPLAIILS
jgi:hypothetical protein